MFAPRLVQLANNSSILVYILGLQQPQAELTVSTNLFSAHAHSVADLRRNIADQMQQLSVYINAEFNRRQHYNGMYFIFGFFTPLNSSTRGTVLDRPGTVYPAISILSSGKCTSSGDRGSDEDTSAQEHDNIFLMDSPAIIHQRTFN
jgi:hypothetical protein